MDISHLYHDSAFGDPTLELDVKEQLKTSEVNAREERNLQRMNERYEKSKFICEKETAWERWKVGQSLLGIWEKSPGLEKRLAAEKARIEAIERNILHRNCRMNTFMSDNTSSSRSLSSISLKPLQDQKKTNPIKPPRKKDKTNLERSENNNNGNSERGSLRQADFVRRSEHSIKALAKLNWRQRTRRRDHEKFKEELFYSNKRVIEKARVVLRGRTDIDVENIYSDFENSLLPPVKKTGSQNDSIKPFYKHQGTSKMSERNVIRFIESVEPKPHFASLVPLPETSEVEGSDRSPVLKQGSSADQKENIDLKIMPSKEFSKTGNENASVSSQPIVCTGDKEALIEKNDPERVPPLSLSDSKTSDNEISSNQILELETISESNSIDDRNTLEKDNASNIDSNSSLLEPLNRLNHYGPLLSVSQVIIEEDEEDLNEGKPLDDGNRLCHDANNNNITQHSESSKGTINTSKTEDSNIMPSTIGNPPLEKQTAKPSEKFTIQVSPPTRKHRKKRKDKS